MILYCNYSRNLYHHTLLGTFSKENTNVKTLEDVNNCSRVWPRRLNTPETRQSKLYVVIFRNLAFQICWCNLNNKIFLKCSMFTTVNFFSHTSLVVISVLQSLVIRLFWRRGETLTRLVLVCVGASQISLDTDNNTEYPDRATHNHYTKLYSFRLSCNIVSFTAAKTNRMFSVSAKEKLNLNQSKSGEKASRRPITKWMFEKANENEWSRSSRNLKIE